MLVYQRVNHNKDIFVPCLISIVVDYLYRSQHILILTNVKFIWHITIEQPLSFSELLETESPIPSHVENVNFPDLGKQYIDPPSI